VFLSPGKLDSLQLTGHIKAGLEDNAWASEAPDASQTVPHREALTPDRAESRGP
jgi:hypothetical protein